MTILINETEARPMSSFKLNQEIQAWRDTGQVSKDKKVAITMYNRFKLISEATIGIPEYDLVARDAQREVKRLHDVIVRKYGERVLYPVHH